MRPPGIGAAGYKHRLRANKISRMGCCCAAAAVAVAAAFLAAAGACAGCVLCEGLLLLELVIDGTVMTGPERPLCYIYG